MFVNILPRLTALILPDIQLRGNPGNIYLTFDDGPNPEITPEIIRICDEYNARATFFVLGGQIAGNESIVKSAAQAGHIIGSHGYEHKSMALLGPKRALTQIIKAGEAVYNCIGRRPVLFRPPYGRLGLGLLAACRAAEQRLVLWRYAPQDWKLIPPKALAIKIKANIHPGDIILLHDSGQYAKNLLSTLPEIIEMLLRMNLKLTGLEEV
ncbi:MAG: polysaccharide deacetylase family protein [Calditrichaeota bacterium]|nr:polysaccharide deacetylase family protein [Calditrichota bacterium]